MAPVKRKSARCPRRSWRTSVRAGRGRCPARLFGKGPRTSGAEPRPPVPACDLCEAPIAPGPPDGGDAADPRRAGGVNALARCLARGRFRRRTLRGAGRERRPRPSESAHRPPGTAWCSELFRTPGRLSLSPSDSVPAWGAVGPLSPTSRRARSAKLLKTRPRAPGAERDGSDPRSLLRAAVAEQGPASGSETEAEEQSCRKVAARRKSCPQEREGRAAWRKDG